MTAHLDEGRSHSTSKLLQQIITLRILSGGAVSDMAVLDDPAVTAMFGWDDIAHQSTYGQRLKLFSWQDNPVLEAHNPGLR